MRPKNADRTWVSPFDPAEGSEHFVEGNSYQYSLFALQDVNGLIDLIGGDERFIAWMDTLFGPAGYVDAFRVVNQEPDQYTWWSNRGQAWAKNVGWRIDYHVTTPDLADKATGAEIYKDERFSDHAPLIMDYDWDNVG